jgi:hypothetical protein
MDKRVLQEQAGKMVKMDNHQTFISIKLKLI